MQGLDPILNPTVFLGAFEWREPVTTLTDFLTAIVCWYAFYRLTIFKGNKPSNFGFYQLYFLCFAIGMTSAAWLGHGLQAYVDVRWKIIGWVCAATGLLMLQRGSLEELKGKIPGFAYYSLRILFVTEFLIAVFLMIHPSYSQFILSQINSTVALVFMILPMHFFNFWKNRAKGSLIIFGAISYGIIPGLIFSNQISYSRWLNYHDISHVLMAGFMLMMFWGVRELVSAEKPQTLSYSS